MVVLMNRNDIDRLSLLEGEMVRLRTSSKDNRAMSGFRVTPYNGCVGASDRAPYPGANALFPLWHYAEDSKTPAAKPVPVTVDQSE